MKGFDTIPTQRSYMLNRGETQCHAHESSVSSRVAHGCWNIHKHKQHNGVISKGTTSGLCSP